LYGLELLVICPDVERSKKLQSEAGWYASPILMEIFMPQITYARIGVDLSDKGRSERGSSFVHGMGGPST
jgi:hypothetical protein